MREIRTSYSSTVVRLACAVVLLILTCFGVQVRSGSAHTLSKTTFHGTDTTVTFTQDAYTVLVIYDLSLTVDQSQYDCGIYISPDVAKPVISSEGWCTKTPNTNFTSIPPGNYAFLEPNGSVDCRDLSYLQCKEADPNAHEIFFRVTAQTFGFPSIYVASEGSTSGGSCSTEGSWPGLIPVVDVAHGYRVTKAVTNLGCFQTLAVSPDQTKLYASDRFAGKVYVIDTETYNVTASIAVENDGEIAITPDGRKGYISSSTRYPDPPAVLWVLDLGTNSVKGTIPGLGGFGFLSMSPDGSRLYVNNDGRQVSVVDVASDTVVGTIPVGWSLQGMVVSPDNSKLYAAVIAQCWPWPCLSTGNVAIINTATQQVEDRIPIGAGMPIGIAITRNGEKLYVVDQQSSAVAVVNTQTKTVQSTISLGFGKDPQIVALSPDGTTAFVTNYFVQHDFLAAEVAVLDIEADRLVTTVSLPGVCLSFYLAAGDRNFTRAGMGTKVSPGSGATVTFAEISSAGNTTVTVSSSGPALPSGFSLGTPPTYYDIGTTAIFTPPVEVCMTYDPAQYGDPTDLRLLHYENNGWVDVTTSHDTTNHLICGRVNGFSLFAVAQRTVTIVSIDIKPGSWPNTINLGSGGTVPVAILSTATFDARTVEPTTLTLASAPVKLKGRGTPMASLEDVNSDGRLDLVVHVETTALQLTDTDTQAIMEGKTFDGTPIRGIDSIRVVP